MAIAKKELIYARECYQVMGLIFKVFNEIGFGHKEKFYQKAIAEEFTKNRIPFKEQLKCRVKYKGKEIGYYIVDFLVFSKIVIELKQKDYVSYKDIKQIYKYLQATNYCLGIIVNLTSRGVRYKRIINIK